MQNFSIINLEQISQNNQLKQQLNQSVFFQNAENGEKTIIIPETGVTLEFLIFITQIQVQQNLEDFPQHLNFCIKYNINIDFYIKSFRKINNKQKFTKCFQQLQNQKGSANRIEFILQLVSKKNIKFFTSSHFAAIDSFEDFDLKNIKNHQDVIKIDHQESFKLFLQKSNSSLFSHQEKEKKQIQLSNHFLVNQKILTNFTNLVYLNACSSKLTDFSLFFEDQQKTKQIQFPFLQYLFINQNNIENFENFPFFPQLKKLCVSSNNIKKSIKFQTFQQAQNLDFQFNQIQSIENLSNNAKKINFRGNQIQNIKSSQLHVSLTQINFSNNLIKELPNLSHLINLKTLDVSFNLLTYFHTNFLPNNLEIILAQENSIGVIQNQTFPKNIKHIDFSGNQMSIFKENNLFGIQYLNLNSNQIKNIDFVSALSDLTEFKADNNLIENVNNAIFSNTLLQIDLDNNKLTNIDNIANKPNLLRIFVRNNAFSENYIQNLKLSSSILSFNF